MLTRRRLIRGSAVTALTLAASRPAATRADPPTLSAELTAFFQGALALGASVRSGALSPTDWQEAMEPLLSRAPLDRIHAELGVDRLRRHARRVTRGCAVVPLTIPAELGAEDGAAMRLFFFERGRTDPPHVHFNSVTAHLVIAGRFEVRHWDRVREEALGFVLRETHDRTIEAGDATSISEARDNGHWHRCVERGVLLDLEQGRLDPSIPPRRRQMIDLGDAAREGEFFARSIGHSVALRRYG